MMASVFLTMMGDVTQVGGGTIRIGTLLGYVVVGGLVYGTAGMM